MSKDTQDNSISTLTNRNKPYGTVLIPGTAPMIGRMGTFYLEDKLKQIWAQKMEEGLFRYKFSKSLWKVLPGQFKFIITLIPNRAAKRREPEPFFSVTEPMDPNKFNFSKINPKEVLFQVKFGEKVDKLSGQTENSVTKDTVSAECEDLVIINASPFEEGHVLLVPDILTLHNQMADHLLIWKTLELMEACGKSFRMVFNSLCAYASVNHQHMHGYYFEGSLLAQYIRGDAVGDGSVFLLRDSFVRGFGFQLSSDGDSFKLAQQIQKFVDVFHSSNIAYSMFLTHGDTFTPSEESPSDVIKVLLWPRKPLRGPKEDAKFHAGSPEIAGHITVYSEDTYNNITEEEIVGALENISLTEQEVKRFLNMALSSPLENDETC